jgi:MFS transporter, SP family, sugar:H+ symporter
VQFLWSIILVGGLIILPETPRFLIKQDRHDKAARSLSRLRRLPADHPQILEELSEIEANHRYEMSLGKASYLDCFKGTVGKRLLTGCLLQALQQLTGVNFIFYYGTQYFVRLVKLETLIVNYINHKVRAGFNNPFTSESPHPNVVIYRKLTF